MSYDDEQTSHAHDIHPLSSPLSAGYTLHPLYRSPSKALTQLPPQGTAGLLWGLTQGDYSVARALYNSTKHETSSQGFTTTRLSRICKDW